MLRAWQDVIAKWQLVASAGSAESSQAVRHFDNARTALVDGRLDEALREFGAAAELRTHPHDEVGIGDVHLARGRWRDAAQRYLRALAIDQDNPLARLGIAQVHIAEGAAQRAALDLERLLVERGDHPVLRYYLASAWCSVGEQCRSRTADDVLVITSEDQLRTCERSAHRILELGITDTELNRGAHRLLDEVAAGQRWTWAPDSIAVSLAVLVVSMGLTMVVAGGAMHSAGLVVAGIALGAALLFMIVLRFRRQVWRLRAERLAPTVARPGR